MTELKKASIKSKVEAVLFSVGHKISLDELSKLCRSRAEDVILALQELKNDYESNQSSLMLFQEDNYWKLTVKDIFIPIARKVVKEIELPKSVLETLAVIAFKYPILQSDLIKIRTNKAYDHLTELEKSGYISRQKHGRTNLIKLTDKFFKYFDLTEEKLKDKFKDFASIAMAIEEKEEEVEKIKEEQLKRAEELKEQDDKIKKEIESLDESDEVSISLETYESMPKNIISEDLTIEKEKLGELDIIDEELNTNQEKEQMPQYKEENVNDIKKQKVKSKGIQLTPEMEKIVEQKVEEIINPEKENKEETVVTDKANDSKS